MKRLLLVGLTLSLLGCFDDSSSTSGDAYIDASLAIATQTSDYETSDIALANYDDNNQVIEGDLATTNPADIGITIYNGDVYRIGRYGYDNLTKFSWDADLEELVYQWQYSVQADDGTGNPQDYIVYNSNVGYISLYDSAYLLKVNPSETNADDFILSEINLSQFAYSGTYPNMTDMVIVGDKLYVLLERLDGWNVVDESWVVVLDAETGNIVKPNDSSSIFDPSMDTLTSDYYINLGTSNAGNFSVYNDTVYVVGRGDYYNSAGAKADDSAIVSFVPNDSGDDIVVTTLIDESYDDGSITIEGNIYSVNVNNDGDIYFSTYVSWGSNNVYFADSLGGNVAQIDLGDSSSYNVSDIANGGSYVYISVHAQFDGTEEPGIKVFDPTTSAVSDRLYGVEDDLFIQTTYNPTQIEVF
ncbi:hypothetical protein [Reinekea marinisedimentorum]|uniref:LVIVD repeat-containing protein n=1 Tax=Reinekea marinisedimentorum TaxID=230495 RepID=A0A4R3HY79_9GAMM|nr:hypothetical protein [Reinekea marinisedimentorum]TCS38158.1 hypothetical protein BCF53_11786 [Reinekea marinisedimentorum]